jgi:putative aminopeptidase FrvX
MAFLAKSYPARLLIGGALLTWALTAAIPGRLPDAVPANAPVQMFSAERAMKHIVAVALKPHPSGSAENVRVRDYIRNELSKLGIPSEIQSGIASRADGPEGKPASAYVENIIARVPGTASTRSLLLLAHYDSVSSGPGAADDASGVGVLLEMARLVQTSLHLRNELVFLFTDGEEVGLLGAELFAQQHPLAKSVGVALNFDSGANGGPVSMYQATEQDEWLVSTLRQALPGAAAQSFTDQRIPQLRITTDLNALQAAGLEGMSFGFMNHPENIHSPYDNIERLDRASVQDLGEYAVATTSAFGNGDLSARRPGKAIYFSGSLIKLIVYRRRWVWPLTLMAVVALAWVTWIGLRRQTRGLWAAVLLWVIAALNVAAAALFPGATYLLTWPLLAGIASLAITITITDAIDAGWKLATLMTSPAAVFLVLVPTISKIIDGLGRPYVRSWGIIVLGDFLLILMTISPQLILLFGSREARAKKILRSSTRAD